MARRRYEYQLQQVAGYHWLHSRMQARQQRVQDMLGALAGVEQRISRMGDLHARHTQEAREHRHRQQEISHKMLRVRCRLLPGDRVLALGPQLVVAPR